MSINYRMVVFLIVLLVSIYFSRRTKKPDPIAEINSKLTSLHEYMKTEISTIKTDISTMQTDISTMKTEISTIKTDISTTKGQIELLMLERGSEAMRLLPWSTLFIKFANHDLSENSTCLGV
jgi:peptidoglycan hydrolase CwlO-like protein